MPISSRCADAAALLAGLSGPEAETAAAAHRAACPTCQGAEAALRAELADEHALSDVLAARAAVRLESGRPLAALRPVVTRTPVAAAAGRSAGGWLGAAGMRMALGGTAAVLALLLALVGRDDWWKGFFAAATASVLSAAASVPPLAWGFRRGVDKTAAGVFVAAGVRALVALAAGALAGTVLRYPPLPTLLLLVVFYFAVLAAETYAVARTLWGLRPPAAKP